MTEEDIWTRKPPRMIHTDGLMYYLSVSMDEWLPEVKARIDLLVEENKQLREAVEMSVDDIRDRMYSGWYQAQIKQSGTLYAYEVDRRRLKQVRNQLDEFPCVNVEDYQRMMKKIKDILEVKK